MGEVGSQSSRAATDGQGVLRLDRDPFLDPRRRVTAVVVGIPELKSPADAWFEVGLGRPRDLDVTVTTSVRTGSLTVVVPQAWLAGGGRPTLTLAAEVARYGAVPMPRTLLELPATSARATFPRLQRGRYRVALSRRPEASPPATPVEVGDRPVTVTLPEPWPGPFS